MKKTKNSVYLDVHPNVIVAHTGTSSEPLFRHVNGTGSMTTVENVAAFKAGFEAKGKKVIISRFDAQGNPVT